MWVWKIPRSKEWQPTPVFFLGKFQGQRSLAGYSPRDSKESDTTEQLSTQWKRYIRIWSLISKILTTLTSCEPIQEKVAIVLSKNYPLFPQHIFFYLWLHLPQIMAIKVGGKRRQGKWEGKERGKKNPAGQRNRTSGTFQHEVIYFSEENIFSIFHYLM